MSDEQRIALAHWRRLACRIEDQDVPDRVAACLSALALLAEDMIGSSPNAVQERARVALALMDTPRD